jgi:hypothetical protein
LPPLNAALAAPEMSYIRSGSTVQSRAHSPSNTYVLPPLHYTNPGIYGSGSPHHRPPTPSPWIPRDAELEKHFMDLSKEKSRLEEMLARTECLMQGVRRGMDETRERELAIALSPTRCSKVSATHTFSTSLGLSPSIPMPGRTTCFRSAFTLRDGTASAGFRASENTRVRFHQTVLPPSPRSNLPSRFLIPVPPTSLVRKPGLRPRSFDTLSLRALSFRPSSSEPVTPRDPAALTNIF